MIRPSIVATADSTNDLNKTFLDVTLPTFTDDSSLLDVMLVSFNGSSTTPAPTGWVEVFWETVSDGLYSGGVFARKSAASGLVTLNFSESQESCARVYRVRNAADPKTRPPLYSFIEDLSSTSHNPPDLTGLHGEDYAFLAVGLMDTYNYSVSAYPTGYTNTGQLNSGGSGSQCSIIYGQKFATASFSEDPSTFTLSVAKRGIAVTLAIPPASTPNRDGGVIRRVGRVDPFHAPHGTPRINRESIQAKNLIGWWPVQSGDGDTLRNVITGDRMMAVQGNPTKARATSGHPVIDFDGTGDAYEGDPTLSQRYNNQDMTFSCRANFDSASDYMYVCALADIGETEAANIVFGFSRYITTGLLYGIWEYGAGTNEPLITSNVAAPSGSDMILTFRRDTVAKTLTFYATDLTLNTFDSEEVAYTNNPTGGTTSHLRFAALGTNDFELFGTMHDMRIYNAAIPESQIRHIHNPNTTWDLYENAQDRVPYTVPKRKVSGGAVIGNRWVG